MAVWIKNMSIKAQTYTFHCRFKTEARLPGYLGSTLRGALGWALKKTSCALRRQQCNSCLLREQCAYAWIFETERYQIGDGRTINARPHPFVLQPYEISAGVKQQGDDFSFSMLLFDRAIDLLPQLIYAVQLMGEGGIGAGRRQGFGRFQLETVRAGKETIFTAEKAVLEQCRDTSKVELEEIADQPISAVQTTLHTPLRLKQGNKLKRDLPFHILIRAGLRRIAALEEAYGGGEPVLDYRGLVKRAEQVQIAVSHLRWHELFRYSNRQKTKVSLSGLVGTVIYKGVLSEFMPILHYCEQVNVGKQTVFGLGRMSVTAKQE